MTRAKNTTMAINKEFSDYELFVDEAGIKTILEKHTTLDPLFASVEKLIRERLKTKLESGFKTQRNKLTSQMIELLKTGSEATWIQDMPGIANGITFKARPIFQSGDVENIIRTALQPRKGLKKGNIKKGIQNYIKEQTFEKFYLSAYPELHTPTIGGGSSLKKLLRDNGLPKQDQDELEDAVTWNPGNIHRGPESKLRLNPEDADHFNESLDDGGDSFEKAAVNLVAAEHYTELTELNGKLDELLGKGDDVLLEPETLDLAIDIIKRMRTIQGRELTQFKKGAWKEVTIGGEKKMRVIPAQDQP